MTPSELKTNFARNLRYLMIVNRVTVKQLATETKICSRNIDRYLAQENVIPMDKMVQIADYFNVSLDFLVTRKKDTLDAEYKILSKVVKSLLKAPLT